MSEAAPFALVPLGPRNDGDGRWCCGLSCGRPCPYRLKIKPRRAAAMAWATRAMPGGPMPLDWMQHGAPAPALAAFAEGYCPVHLAPLDLGSVRFGGAGGAPVRWVDAGWCGACAAWWYGRAFDGVALGCVWETP